MAKKYCVCILFNKELTKTLLIEKAEGKLFAGMFNGLGGKLEPNETAKESCIREIWEESSELITLTDPTHLATIHFPHEEPITLHAFYDVIDEITLPTNREGVAHWLPIDFLLDFNNNNIVGYGNLPYFCKLALRRAHNLEDL
jgi:8-oxo-dGTP diphosphatase